MRDVIEKKFGIEMKNLSLSEQFRFLQYIKNHTVDEMKPVEKLIQTFGIAGARTFLSIEQGGKKMGNKILDLGEKLPKESAEVLFKTYGDMIDASDEVVGLLKNKLGEKVTPEIINKVKESLLLNGKNLLERYAKQAQTCEGIDCETLGQELKERLSLAKKSVFTFSYACKTLVERGKFSFEDFKKAKLSYDQSPIPEEMRAKIIAMHTENTKQYPDKLKNLWRGTLKDGLNNPDENQLIVSASYEDEVVSGMRVIKQPDGSWYGASFNVNPTVQGSRIGTELFKKVILDLAQDKPFIADCYSKNPMLETYLNKFGFKITKEIENYHDTGELVYQITLYPKKEN